MKYGEDREYKIRQKQVYGANVQLCKSKKHRYHVTCVQDGKQKKEGPEVGYNELGTERLEAVVVPQQAGKSGPPGLHLAEITWFRYHVTFTTQSRDNTDIGRIYVDCK